MNKRGEGILLARKLRRSNEFRNFSKIPTILLSDIKTQTDFKFPSVTVHPYRLPVDEFMEKPVTPAQLTAKIGSLLALTK